MFSLARILAGIFVGRAAVAEVTIPGRIVDENGAGVGEARVLIGSARPCVSDPTGAFTLELPGAGRYLTRVERDGFFPLKDFPVDIASDTRELHLTISHAREVFEKMNVSASIGRHGRG